MANTETENLVRCERCGRLCRGSKTQKPEARMLRKAMKGECINCAIVTFLQRTMNMYNEGSFPGMPEGLRLPHVQQQFEAVMRAGMSEATPDEIDWNLVIASWNVGEKRKDCLF